MYGAACGRRWHPRRGTRTDDAKYVPGLSSFYSPPGVVPGTNMPLPFVIGPVLHSDVGGLPENRVFMLVAPDLSLESNGTMNHTYLVTDLRQGSVCHPRSNRKWKRPGRNLSNLE